MFDSAGFRDGLGLAAAIDRAALTSLRPEPSSFPPAEAERLSLRTESAMDTKCWATLSICARSWTR